MDRFIEHHTGETFDLIVIGGGISGASVAYEAATRGLKVALVEKRDFASATSSASSKLIHGGLRYLVNGEIGMVRESLRERRVLENIAPNFVYPARLVMAHYKEPFKNRRWVVKLGMIAYDLLSFDKGHTWDPSKKIPMHCSISAEEALKREPNLKPDGLTGASVFYDCQSIAPERLTLAFLNSAIALGAKAANYAEVTGFLQDGQGKVGGVTVVDKLSGKAHEIRATVTVNCGGPWADIVMGLGAAKDGAAVHTIRRSEGIHIIIDKDKYISGDSIIGAVTAGGSHFFLIPWRGHTLIGTTDKPYTGDPDAYRVTKQAIEELIATVNSAYGIKLAYADVRFAYGGLRPLVEEQTKDTYTSSRRYEIFDNAANGLDGLITVEGGKFTTTRDLAEHCLDMVAKKLGRSLGVTVTKDKDHQLVGSKIPDLTLFLAKAVRENTDFDTRTVDFASRHYGTDYPAVLKLAREDTTLAEVVTHDGEILAEVVYAVRVEMARTLGDIIFLRTGIGTLGHPGDTTLRKVAAIAANELGWDAAKMEGEIALANERLKVPEN